jgi:MarR family transcriptional regulator, transcriptional regulator for hemolysin
MLEYDFENSPGFWICQASQAFQRAFNEELAPQGITFRQCQVLGCLALEGPLPQNDLAERMGIEPPTLVGILDRMERDGWISRNADLSDRRRKLIHVMPAARPVWSKIVSTANRVRSRATAGLTKQQLSELKRLLGVVQANLQAESASKEAG